MWGLISRLVFYTYDMIFRISQRLFSWTANKLSRLTGAPPMDKPAILPKNKFETQDKKVTKLFTGTAPPPPPPPLPTATISSSAPSFTAISMAQIEQNKEIVIDMDALEKVQKVIVHEKPLISAASLPRIDAAGKVDVEISSKRSYKPEEKKGKGNASAQTASKSHAKKPKMDTAAGSQSVDDSNTTTGCQSVVDSNAAAQSSQFQTKEKKRLNKRKHKKKASALNAASEEEDSSKSVQKEDFRPNFFVAFQISNNDIKSKVFEIQESILNNEISSEPLRRKSSTGVIFKDAMIPIAKLHFTLHVFHLKDNEQIQRAKEILGKCFDKVKQEFEKDPITLNIQGLGHFRNSVIFAKIKEAGHISRLECLCGLLRDEFDSAGIVGDNKIFQPHLTIAKMSRSKKLHKMKVRSFPAELWTQFESQHFGYQKVESLQLLSMTESDQITGYYRTILEFPFT